MSSSKVELSFPRPSLSRSYATVPSFPEEKSADDAVIIENVLTAYETVGIKGEPLVVAGGVVVCSDSWLCDLEECLEDLSFSGHLQSFSLEVWLTDKVDTMGTQLQREKLGELRRKLDDYESAQVFDKVISSGLPDNITAVYNQPLTEIEVYRGISKLAVQSCHGEQQQSEQRIDVEARQQQQHCDGDDDADDQENDAAAADYEQQHIDNPSA